MSLTDCTFAKDINTEDGCCSFALRGPGAVSADDQGGLL